MNKSKKAAKAAQTTDFTEVEVVNNVTAEAATEFILETEASIELTIDNDFYTSKKGIKLESPLKRTFYGKTTAKAIGAAVREAYFSLNASKGQIDSPIVTIGKYKFVSEDIKEMRKISYEQFSATHHDIYRIKAVAGNVDTDSVTARTEFVKGVALEEKKALVKNVSEDLFNSAVLQTIQEVTTRMQMNMDEAKNLIQSEETRRFNEQKSQTARVQKLLNKERDKSILMLERAKEENRLLAQAAQA